MRELLTNSRMNSVMTCPRKAYYEYELGLKPIVNAEPFRFGSAWHTAMEARWQGKDVDNAFECAINSGKDLDEQILAVISGLLAGYYTYWQSDTHNGEVIPEQEFRQTIDRSLTFDAGGKIDAIIKRDGRVMLLEHKTTTEDLSDDSLYWNRLRFNMQLYQYYLGAKSLGYEVDEVIYDVTRKPMIRQHTAVPILDAEGLKIVVDKQGNRVIGKNGKPRQTSDNEKGYEVQTQPKTMEAFSQRLANDTMQRPEFYFARRQVSVLISDLESFIDQRLEVGKQILHYRAREKKVGMNGWPRNVQFWTCGRLCPYDSFCLQNAEVDVNNPPMGFEIGKKHQELNQAQ